MRKMNSKIAPLVTLSRTGAAAQARLDSGHPLPGDDARVRDARKAEKRLAKHGIDVVGARRGAIHPARGNHRRRRSLTGAAA